MSAQVATWYGAYRVLLATVTAPPMSITSGARCVVPSCLTASISCWLEPSGVAEATLMPYLVPKALMISP